MRYYINTQSFSYKITKGIFNKKEFEIDELIFIDITNEKGETYYALNKDFNLNKAWNKTLLDRWGNEYYYMQPLLEKIWKKHIDSYHKYLTKLQGNELMEEICEWDRFNTDCFNYKNFKDLLNHFGKSFVQIQYDVKNFINYPYYLSNNLIIDKEYYPVFYGNNKSNKDTYFLNKILDSYFNFNQLEIKKRKLGKLYFPNASFPERLIETSPDRNYPIILDDLMLSKYYKAIDDYLNDF